MKGDFSKWTFDPTDNFTGLLQQQGRVMLDTDTNALTQIMGHWHHTMGQDAIGANVAAVPADLAGSFKVIEATSDGVTVDVTVQPGRVWADGLPITLGGSADATFEATYLVPPIQDPQASAATIAAGIHDAVVLEVWEEAFNGFQDPRDLIEPALGGPDTSERVKASMALRLLRLGPGDECGNLDLADDFASKGRLTANPGPTTVIAGDCPVELGGGYTGFEHYLFRIEIAEPNGAGDARFKWSQFNGGLVGRGEFDVPSSRVQITANNQMINHCGLTEFYLEALQFDSDRAHWRVVFSADATLTQDDVLTLANTQGAWPPGTPQDPSAFFRLWNDIELISDYPTGLPTPNELHDGIHLAFDAPTGNNDNYTPGDFWNFPVRAAGVPIDLSLWPNNDPPEGIHYHRVPLAILNWASTPPVTITAPTDIHDCRHVFPPLSKRQSCCRFTVGDGMVSFGHYDTIQEAVNNLPAAGGEICVLPGDYVENVVIDSRTRVTIKGCGARSRVTSVAPAGSGSADPVFRITNSDHIRIEGFAILADNTGVGVLVEGNPVDIEGGSTLSDHITLHKLNITAATRSAIEVQAGEFITITKCRIRMADMPSPWPGIFIIADDARIEHNRITVQRSITAGSAAPTSASTGRGGLQIGGTSERIHVIDNFIQGGIGNGITLGSLRQVDASGGVTDPFVGWVIDIFDPCDPCGPGDGYLPPPPPGGSGPTYESMGPLYNILIERNRIFSMGLNGIGVVSFFDIDAVREIISIVGLTIIGNDIRECLQRPLAPIPAAMIDRMGYGGISLADIENLVIQHNRIEDNGPDHIEPVCGIFVFHAEGMDVTDNKIVNNGAKTAQPSNTAKAGRRGGINVVAVTADTVPTEVDEGTIPRGTGVPAIKVHDNIVSTPLGRALSLAALGPVSVVDNQFTSRGMVLQFNPISPSFIATTVFILNLGMSDELPWAQLLSSFKGIAGGHMAVPITNGALNASDNFVVMTHQPARARKPFLGLQGAGGNVLFSDNQVTLDLMEEGLGLALSSIAIFSLDDVGFHSNQCNCALRDDFLLTNAFLFGISLRVSDNRFKEGWFNTLYSALTLGLMNATTNNQGTHCIEVATIIPALEVDDGNKVLLAPFLPGYCGKQHDSVGSTGLVNIGKFEMGIIS